MQNFLSSCPSNDADAGVIAFVVFPEEVNSYLWTSAAGTPVDDKRLSVVGFFLRRAAR